MSDFMLGTCVSGLIETARLRRAHGANNSWTPGKKLKLLIAGYNGARNTGEEVRVEEMVRQFRRVLGEGNVQLSVLTLNPKFSEGYYGDATQVHLPFIFPPFLYREVPRYDGVVASCGSMLSSKFSNVHCIMMIEALAIASAQRKLSIAYGGEAGGMDPILARMCRRYCARTSIIVRNEESRAALQKLGISSHVGADTAWTFEPLSADFGHKTLRSAGWDGTQTILAVCPNNPFWWPVKPSLLKATAWAVTNAYRDSHYKSIYFHRSGTKVKEAYGRYVAALAGAMEVFRKERGVFSILAGLYDARQFLLCGYFVQLRVSFSKLKFTRRASNAAIPMNPSIPTSVFFPGRAARSTLPSMSVEPKRRCGTVASLERTTRLILTPVISRPYRTGTRFFSRPSSYKRTPCIPVSTTTAIGCSSISASTRKHAGSDFIGTPGTGGRLSTEPKVTTFLRKSTLKLVRRSMSSPMTASTRVEKLRKYPKSATITAASDAVVAPTLRLGATAHSTGTVSSMLSTFPGRVASCNFFATSRLITL